MCRLFSCFFDVYETGGKHHGFLQTSSARGIRAVLCGNFSDRSADCAVRPRQFHPAVRRGHSRDGADLLFRADSFSGRRAVSAGVGVPVRGGSGNRAGVRFCLAHGTGGHCVFPDSARQHVFVGGSRVLCRRMCAVPGDGESGAAERYEIKFDVKVW